MIIRYIVEENIFAGIVYKILVQKEYYNVILKTALKLMANKEFQSLKKVSMFNSKILREK